MGSDTTRTPSLQRVGLLLTACGLMTQVASALVTIDSVDVGDMGNPADWTGLGGVNYGYSIGKYEVTISQYTEFLNAVAVTDPYGLYNPQMGSDPNIMGIARAGSSGSYSYSLIGSGLRPVTYVSWYDAARFVNWLHNGQATGLPAAGTTETGAYTLNGALSGTGFTRNANWTFGLPSKNEWYKAAYYQPAAQGGDADGYWLYPTASNDIPNSRSGSATDPNSGNFYRNDGIANGFNGGYAVPDSTTFSSSQNYLTDVGAFSLADSFYGTLDQGGNVWEWNDAVEGVAREWRGGAWNYADFGQRASDRAISLSAFESSSLGFRVVIVPEPSLLGLMGLGALLVPRKRKVAADIRVRRNSAR